MKKLACLIIFVFVSVMAAQANIDPSNIAGTWLFDEGSGDVAADSSGNGNDGVVDGATWTNGKFGGGLLFEDAGGVAIESAGMLQVGDQLTIMAYFSAQVLDDWHQLIAKDGEYLLRIDPPSEGGNMSSFFNLDGGWEPRSSAGVPGVDTWTHFAAAYSSADGKLRTFVNGVLITETERVGAPNPGDAPVTIGHWNDGNNFVGVIDEVAIFDVALSEADIKSIVDNGLVAALGLDGPASVKPSDKVTTTWGDLK